jgi:hypothetical protein
VRLILLRGVFLAVIAQCRLRRAYYKTETANNRGVGARGTINTSKLRNVFAIQEGWNRGNAYLRSLTVSTVSEVYTVWTVSEVEREFHSVRVEEV